MRALPGCAFSGHGVRGRCAGRALALAVAQTSSHVKETRARLKRYQEGKPYHEPAPSDEAGRR